MKGIYKEFTWCIFGVLCALMLVAAQPSWAQGTAQPSSGKVVTPADPGTLLTAGESVVGMVDQGLASDLWQHVSSAMRAKILTKESFVQGIYNSRRPLGVAANRQWANISQIMHPGSDTTPAGHYITVSFLTDFAGKSGMREHVTFRLDEDGVWRIAGYALQ